MPSELLGAPAQPENVSFHASCSDAEAAGFRPCRRCRPNEPSRAERQAEAVARACRLIEEAEAVPALDALAEEVGMSPFHFHRVFRSVTGITPKTYAAAQRAERVAAGLREADTVTQALYEAGYKAPSRFYAGATERLGMTPAPTARVGSAPASALRWRPARSGRFSSRRASGESVRSCSATSPKR